MAAATTLAPEAPQAQWGPAGWLDAPPKLQAEFSFKRPSNFSHQRAQSRLLARPGQGLPRWPRRGAADCGSGQSIYGLEAIVDFTPHVVRLTCSNGAAKSVAKKRDEWDWA